MRFPCSMSKTLMGVMAVLALAGCEGQAPKQSSPSAIEKQGSASEAGGYAVTAQFYDVMAEPFWESKLGPALARALQDVRPSGGPIIDIGAGTGLSTAAIVRAVPDARVLAIEPDPAMRAALMTRLMSDDKLREQVSIIPAGLFEADLPPRISAAVAISVIHHFTPVERKQLWAMLAERLTPDGLAIIEIQLPTNEAVPLTRMAQARIGDVAYEGWMEAVPIGPNLQRWRMRYRALRNGAVIDDQSTTYDMHVAGFDEVAREVTAAGLDGRRDGDFIIIRRSPEALGSSDEE